MYDDYDTAMPQSYCAAHTGSYSVWCFYITVEICTTLLLLSYLILIYYLKLNFPRWDTMKCHFSEFKVNENNNTNRFVTVPINRLARTTLTHTTLRLTGNVNFTYVTSPRGNCHFNFFPRGITHTNFRNNASSHLISLCPPFYDGHT
jgi:hypothetical protein